MGKYSALVRKASADGMVLLKNENQMLPLKKGEHVAVFGRMQLNTYRCGTGSGGDVFIEHSVDLQEGMNHCSEIIWDKEVMHTYKAWCEEHPYDFGNGVWASEPWHQEEMPLDVSWVKTIAQKNKKAIVVIGRTAGEDMDNSDVVGSYQLTDKEKQMLNAVCSSFDQVAVILNVANIIDMSFFSKPEYDSSIKSILYAWQGGIDTGNAIVDILTGAVTPSGKLSATIANRLEDYPSTSNYGSESRNVYEEDIFVGYRYFETFAPEKVMYPFGYGLSYTSFSIEDAKASTDWEEQTLTIQAAVKNTGTTAGKEVVQVYAQAPAGKLGKAKRVLIGFYKTDLLESGTEETMSIEIPFHRFASYDDSGVTGKKSAWILEAGQYEFYIGADCRCAQKLNFEDGDWVLLEDMVLEQLEEAAAPIIDAKRMVQRDTGICMESMPKRTVDIRTRIKENEPEKLISQIAEPINLRQVYEGKAKLEDLVSQLTDEELCAIVRGEGMSSPKVTPGTASAFGGVTESLMERQIPIICTADGPSGIRMEKILPVTQIPIGTSLACSFDLSLVEELYVAISEEMHQHQVDFLLGPGMNIQRSPLNGRNFEYFSEDPLLTGYMASACIKGLKKNGAHGTLKHFACNNQEWKRHEVEAVVSERALREIYLKGFEIVVKEGGAKSIMTTYNPLNGYWNASNYDLLTTILRKQWGFKGIVMTDWWACVNDVIEGGVSNKRDMASMVMAQNDLYMVVPNYGAKTNESGDNLEESLENGKLKKAYLQQCAMNILTAVMDTQAFLEKRPCIVKYAHMEPFDKEEKGICIGKECSYAMQANEPHEIYISEEGVYTIGIEYCIYGHERMQVGFGITLNDTSIAMFITNGTEGELRSRKITKIYLYPGTYKVSTYAQADLVEIKSMNWCHE